MQKAELFNAVLYCGVMWECTLQCFPQQGVGMHAAQQRNESGCRKTAESVKWGVKQTAVNWPDSSAL
jgi:hypothetical protein